MLGHGLWKFLPESLKESFREWVRRTSQPSAGLVLAKLYEPLPLTSQGETLFFDSRDFARAQTETYVEGVPIPATALRKGYGKSPLDFLEGAYRTASMLRSVMSEQEVVLGPNAAVLDWGCATGRVLEQFRREAADCEFWGADIDGSSIAWAKEHFSPPFHFVTCTLYPHLPFEDGKFFFIYAGSVFTHIRYLEDFWLLELNRILRPGGVMVVTILDENSVQWFRRHYVGPRRIPPNFDLSQLTAHDQVFLTGEDWAAELSFVKLEWIRRAWGLYFDVVDVKPEAEGYQTAIVLRKKQSRRTLPG